MEKQQETTEKIKRIDVLITEVWKYYDEDENGYLDREEAKHLFKDIFANMGQKVNEVELKYIMDSVDTDGDQKITQEEFKKLLLS